MSEPTVCDACGLALGSRSDFARHRASNTCATRSLAREAMARGMSRIDRFRTDDGNTSFVLTACGVVVSHLKTGLTRDASAGWIATREYWAPTWAVAVVSTLDTCSELSVRATLRRGVADPSVQAAVTASVRIALNAPNNGGDTAVRSILAPFVEGHGVDP